MRVWLGLRPVALGQCGGLVRRQCYRGISRAIERPKALLPTVNCCLYLAE